VAIGLIPRRTSRADVIGALYRVADVDPTAIDDADDGYRVGFRWVNRLTGGTFTLVDATPGGAVWAQEDGTGGGGGGPVSLGGDLAGTSSAGWAKTVRGLSATLAYDGNGRLSTVTTSHGTKTMSYDGNGRLASIAATGGYRPKSFTYDGNGRLEAVTVS
jgi:YD repeat-containing protein